LARQDVLSTPAVAKNNNNNSSIQKKVQWLSPCFKCQRRRQCDLTIPDNGNDYYEKEDHSVQSEQPLKLKLVTTAITLPHFR